jgi:ribosome-associated protein
MSQPARSVRIAGPWIELNKLLKREGVAATGGEAKLLVASGLVRVNGQVENRIRRKLVSGDRVTCQDLDLLIQA